MSTPVAQPEGQLRKCRITEEVPNPINDQCPKERKRYPALVSLSNTAVYSILTHINIMWFVFFFKSVSNFLVAMITVWQCGSDSHRIMMVFKKQSLSVLSVFSFNFTVFL